MKQFRSLSTVVAATGLVWCVVAGWWIWTTPVRFSGIAGTMEPAGARAVERVEYRLISDISEFAASCHLWYPCCWHPGQRGPPAGSEFLHLPWLL